MRGAGLMVVGVALVVGALAWVVHDFATQCAGRTLDVGTFGEPVCR